MLNMKDSFFKRDIYSEYELPIFIGTPVIDFHAGKRSTTDCVRFVFRELICEYAHS